MTQRELSSQLFSALRVEGLSSALASRAVRQMVRLMREATLRGESIFMRNFGTIQVTTMKAKKGRNFKTNEVVLIPKHDRIRFVPALGLCKKLKKAGSTPNKE